MLRRNQIHVLGTAFLITLMGVMMTAASALGQSPTQVQYHNSVTPSGGSTAPLPFTGFDAVAFAVVGLGLVAAGLIVFRMTRETRSRAFENPQ